MGEELQESEVVFRDSNDDCFHPQEAVSSPTAAKKTKKSKSKKKKKKMAANSPPVNIPEILRRYRDGEDQDREYYWEEEGDEDDDGGELVPPHVMVGRRIAGQMAFSVCTGNGRTLKGRDLSRVRNSILRMTGFLES